MASSAPSHTTESISDRKKARELAEARQSGAMAPAIDVKTGHMINPHNPDFITKRPWYLGDDNDTSAGPSLDHQQKKDPTSNQGFLSMHAADALVQQERQRLKEQRHKQQFQIGMWVEAMKQNKGPYKICQIVKIAKKGTVFDLKYEDGSLERKVKFKQKDNQKKKALFYKPRIRMTKTGTRSLQIDATKHGKESFDSKRDKYHGYDQETHTKKVTDLFQQRDDIRKQIRQEEEQKEKEAEGGDGTNKEAAAKEKDRGSDSDSDADSDVGSDSDDEFVQKDEDDKGFTTRLARQGGVGGAQMKVTARNLRIREDTAKYLRNLDLSSAYYDPKSRSMRDNPNPEVAAEEAAFAGDNFSRISGDAVNLAQTHLFAWDAADKGAKQLHPQANPSQVELLKKKFQSKSADLAMQKKKKVLDKYGGQEYLDGSGGLANAVEKDGSNDAKSSSSQEERKIRFGVSTVQQEYNRDGQLIKGPARPQMKAQKSKYEEDIFINGHKTVWGSYFHFGAFEWGYRDDHSLIKNSYCTGETGRKANDDANEMRYGTGVSGSAALAQARGLLTAVSKQNGGNGGAGKNQPPSKRSELYGEADQNVDLDMDKLKEAMEKKDQQNQGDKKRKYNSMNADIDVTKEEMEAYRLRKGRASDPMAQVGSDKLLDYK